MKFGKIAIFVTLFSMCGPAAFADFLYGSISTSGTATVASTGTYPNDVATSITYASPVTLKSSPYYDQSKGGLISGDGSFGLFNASATVYYVPGATSTFTTGGNHVACTVTITTNCRKPAAYTFPTTGGTTVNGVTTFANGTLATPLELFTVTEGGNTLIFYLTEIDTTVAGLAKLTTGPLANQHAAIASALTGVGYVTLNGGDTTYGTYSRIASTAGTGKQAFSATFTSTVPEPSSLALLGTGMIGIAGFVFRKRSTV
ncbi:MAG TPA: PEP-CTERM sorting domain-containing protein [Acidobacteriaceae bacterium]|nr:PEP-CTERM sorting domain-containing protein [Acidobacteriaceae bacterium]